jgi:ribonuclease HI
MARTVESKQLLCALTSADTPEDTELAGIGVIIKSARRHTLRKIARSTPTQDRVTAAYEDIATALREARKMGARAIVVYTDCEGVVNQLRKAARVDESQLARHLEARSLLNQFHRAEVKLASPEQSRAAHELAVEAREEGVRDAPWARAQLVLPMADTGTG